MRAVPSGKYAASPQRSATSEPRFQDPMPGGETKRILIIDDEPDITASLKLGLEHYGFSVDTYNNPVYAIEEYGPGRYDLTFLDIRMPELTGFEVARRLRIKDPDAKIWFMTAFEVNEKEFDTLFSDAHIDGFIQKPISASKLARLITQYVEGLEIAPPTKIKPV